MLKLPSNSSSRGKWTDRPRRTYTYRSEDRCTPELIVLHEMRFVHGSSYTMQYTQATSELSRPDKLGSESYRPDHS